MSGKEARMVRMLRENQDSAISALQRGDMAAYRALSAEEARIVDDLRAIWKARG